MRPTTSVAVVRVIAAAVFIGGAGVLVQSFAEGDDEAAQPVVDKISAAKAMAAAGEDAFPDFIVAPVKVRTVKVPVPEAPPPVPAGSDPRWAKTDHDGGQPVAASTAAPEPPENTLALAALPEHEPAGEGFAAITGSTSGMPAIDIAVDEETPEFDAVDSAVLAAAREDFSDDDPARTTRINSDVRLRSRGSNRSEVIGVIPGGATVGVVRCAAWCQVTYEGKRGWVYNSFVSGYERRRPAGLAAPAPQAAPAAAVAEAAPKPRRGGLLGRLFGNPADSPGTGTND